jgi:hypothetical protein
MWRFRKLTVFRKFDRRQVSGIAVYRPEPTTSQQRRQTGKLDRRTVERRLSVYWQMARLLRNCNFIFSFSPPTVTEALGV